MFFFQFVTGWGRSTTDPSNSGQLLTAGASTAILQQLKVPTVPVDECKKFFTGRTIIPERHICAGGDIGEDLLRLFKTAQRWYLDGEKFGTKKVLIDPYKNVTEWHA